MDPLPQFHGHDGREHGPQRPDVLILALADDQGVRRLAPDLGRPPAVQDAVGPDPDLSPGGQADVDRVGQDALDPVVAERLVVVLEPLLPQAPADCRNPRPESYSSNIRFTRRMRSASTDGSKR